MLYIRKIFVIAMMLFLGTASCFAAEYSKELNVKTGDARRLNILKLDYKETGVGCYYDANGTDKRYLYWAQLFQG